VTLVVLTIVAAVSSRTATLRRLVVETLAERLDSEVELGAFSVDTFPRVLVRGTGLVVRLRGARDIPPLVKIESFSIEGGIFGLLQRPRRFSLVTLQGLEINIPPGGPNRRDPGSPSPADTPGEAEPGQTGPENRRDSTGIHVEKLLSSDALLRIIPRKAGKDPKEFAIHWLEIDGVGVEGRMPFRAELTNPLPRGMIRTEGQFGPWNREAPAGTPVQGRYVFENVDLSTVKGIGGTLSSTGEFGGRLERIEVNGETETPDFHLAYARRPIPLTTRFHAVVDGTDGDTYLETVNAQLRRTPMVASGAIVGIPGKGRSVQVNVDITQGRVEDILHLVMKSGAPVLTGHLALKTDFNLPPGPGDVVERLQLRGAFDLDAAGFTDGGVSGKLASMSARASGTDTDNAPDRVLTDLEGRFTVTKATVSLPDVRFRLPGAAVQLAGTYGLRSEEMEFDGTLRMQATVSEAAGGGIKGFLLKAVDPLFRKKGAGAVLPIKVRGTRDEPKLGLDVVKAITPK